MNSNRKFATIHLFEYENEDEDCPDTMEEVPDLLNRLEALYPGFSSELQRGDIINNILGDQYRSSGSFMVDLDPDQQPKLVDRDFTYDDHGGPNTCFLGISEFPLNFWDPEEMTVNAKWVDDTDANEFYWHMEPPMIKIDPAQLGLESVSNDDFTLLETDNPKENLSYYVFTYKKVPYLLIGNDCIQDQGWAGELLMKYYFHNPDSEDFEKLHKNTQIQMAALAKIIHEHNISPDHLVCVE